MILTFLFLQCFFSFIFKAFSPSFQATCSFHSFSTQKFKTKVLFITFYEFTYSLRKPIDSHWFKNVLFDLFSLQLCVLFSHKMMTFYKEISSAWISRTFVLIILSQVDVICVVKIQQKYLWSIEMHFHRFFQAKYE